MIYVVSNEPLISSEIYQLISIDEALKLLDPLQLVGLDTETEGFDPYTKKLKTIQLGCYDFQIVIDCLTIDVQLLKPYLESNRTFIG